MRKVVGKGSVVAVCVRPLGGIPKFPQDSIKISKYGFLGDFHCRQFRESRTKPGTYKHNERQVTIVAQEVLDLVNKDLKLKKPLKPGDLGENITVTGLGDLSKIKPWSLIRLNRNILLRVTEQNTPCKKLLPYHKKIIKVLIGRRGLLCEVLKGYGASLRPGNKVVIIE